MINHNAKWEAELNEADYENKEDFLWFNVLRGCGCGSSDELHAIAWEVFEHFSKPHDERTVGFIYDKLEREVIAHWLDSKGNLTMHGGSVAGSWFTEEGQALYDVLTSAVLIKDFLRPSRPSASPDATDEGPSA